MASSAMGWYSNPRLSSWPQTGHPDGGGRGRGRLMVRLRVGVRFWGTFTSAHHTSPHRDGLTCRGASSCLGALELYLSRNFNRVSCLLYVLLQSSSALSQGYSSNSALGRRGYKAPAFLFPEKILGWVSDPEYQRWRRPTHPPTWTLMGPVMWVRSTQADLQGSIVGFWAQGKLRKPASVSCISLRSLPTGPMPKIPTWKFPPCSSSPQIPTLKFPP